MTSRAYATKLHVKDRLGGEEDRGDSKGLQGQQHATERAGTVVGVGFLSETLRPFVIELRQVAVVLQGEGAEVQLLFSVSATVHRV